MLPILLHTRLVVTVKLVLTEYYYHCYYNHTPLHRVELQLVLGFEKGNGMVDAFVLFLCDGPALFLFLPPNILLIMRFLLLVFVMIRIIGKPYINIICRRQADFLATRYQETDIYYYY
jgi:hypothetical protein